MHNIWQRIKQYEIKIAKKSKNIIFMYTFIIINDLILEYTV